MRKVVVLCLFLSACSGSSKFYKDYDIGAEKQVTVGSVMVTASSQVNTADQTTKITEQLVYGGVAGRIIKINAREYGEDLTKPIAFQELQYDLSESEVITYRDLTIQVLEASNKQIRFKVLTGPENPNAPKEEGPAEKEAPPKFPQ
jgi:hypothetical protein